MGKELTGGCLCGAVRFVATPVKVEMGVCHCSMCRRWSGGTFMAVDCGDSVKFENEDKLGIYTSSNWAQRGFCTTCGTTLLWQTKDLNHRVLTAQSFDDPGQFTFNSEIFIDEKPDNYSFANETEKMTGAEVFAKFAP